MKINVRMFIMLLLCTFLSTNNFAQTPQKNPTIIDTKKAGKLEALSASEFANSVVAIQQLEPFQGKPKSYKAPLELLVLNFHQSKKLLPVYTFGGITYNDDGKYLDKVAGDGIFTSTKAVYVKADGALPNRRYLASPDFKYKEAMDDYMNGTYGIAKTGIKISCETRTVTCPETNWWNSCWPFSSPCQCVEFYDCEIEVEIEF